MKSLLLITAFLTASPNAFAAKLMHCNDQIHDVIEYNFGDEYSWEFLSIDHNRRTGNSTYIIAIETSETTNVLRLLLETKTCEFVSSQVANSQSELERSDRMRSEMDEENLDEDGENLY